MGSIFVLDLQSGEELAINADVAMSGLSILKIGIFVEAFRALDGPPDAYQQQILMDTATRSSNYGANLLLHLVAGENNTYKGADILTESMHQLGLVNTFMAVPYDATPPSYRQTTYLTPANSRTDIDTQPDPTMQTTAEEIGTLLAMIYDCSKGGGGLIAVYPEQLTPDECQSIIDLMVLNEEGNLIRYGVPDEISVSHKHGWALGTHADAGIVLSPGGDFVLVEYLNQPGEWLLADVSFPVLREIARAVYNYFNMDHPYLGDALIEQGIIDPNNPFSESFQADVAEENGADTEETTEHTTETQVESE
jgi:beta-lactamase class A